MLNDRTAKSACESPSGRFVIEVAAAYYNLGLSSGFPLKPRAVSAALPVQEGLRQKAY